MSPVVRALLILGLVAAALVGGPAASASALTLKADSPETGWVRLSVPDAGDATNVALSEQVAGVAQPLTQAPPTAGQLVVPHAAPWRCDRLTRTFNAIASYPDGSTQTATASTTTPSCAKRLALSAHKRKGRIVVSARDRWGIGGVGVRICVSEPGREPPCNGLQIPAGSRTGSRSYRTRAAGVWQLLLSTGWGQHTAATFYVRPKRALRLLATGDSMIQIVDSYLKDGLGKRNIHVRSDARISTGLSKPFLLNWPRLAQKQASGIRPDVTVVFIGANDGFPFGRVDCCGDAWVAAYAKRAESMMRSYLRQNHGLVYWLTLPSPRPAQWKPIYPAVNKAIKRAAAAFNGAVKVLDIAKTFTPGYRFRSTMRWHGRYENVRNSDGVHLSAAGAAIAATLIERAMRRDGIIG